jgi:hypothetical protein
MLSPTERKNKLGRNLEEFLAAIEAAKPHIIYKHGACVYSVDDGPPKKVSSTEDELLTKFIGCPAHSESTLRTDVSVSNIAQAFKRLRQRYGRYFEKAVRVPGGKSKGGYHAIVQMSR